MSTEQSPELPPNLSVPPDVDPAIHEKFWRLFTIGIVASEHLVSDLENQDLITTLNEKDAMIGSLKGDLANAVSVANALLSENNQLKKQLKEVTESSVTDPLTGLLNRRGANELYQRLQLESRTVFDDDRRENPTKLVESHLLVVDIDNFKQVNDAYGHPVGDLTLQAIARILKTNTRLFDIHIRWGGDEMVIIMPSAPRSGAVNEAEAIRQEVRDSRIKSSIKTTVSIGVSKVDFDMSLADNVAATFQALSDAKKRGKNRVEYFESQPESEG